MTAQKSQQWIQSVFQYRFGKGDKKTEEATVDFAGNKIEEKITKAALKDYSGGSK